MMRRLALIVSLAVPAGCASSTSIMDFYEADSPTLLRFQKMDLVEDALDARENFRNLGEVEGLFCEQGWAGTYDVHDRVAQKQAIDQVKLKAAALGATRISQPVCITSPKGGVANNCSATLVCTANALQERR